MRTEAFGNLPPPIQNYALSNAPPVANFKAKHSHDKTRKNEPRISRKTDLEMHNDWLRTTKLGHTSGHSRINTLDFITHSGVTVNTPKVYQSGE
jgi:hypothetical protein